VQNSLPKISTLSPGCPGWERAGVWDQNFEAQRGKNVLRAKVPHASFSHPGEVLELVVRRIILLDEKIDSLT
jgi:hypothetical protein